MGVRIAKINSQNSSCQQFSKVAVNSAKFSDYQKRRFILAEQMFVSCVQIKQIKQTEI